MGGEPEPKEGIFLITAQEISLLIGGDKQRSGDRAQQAVSKLAWMEGTRELEQKA